MLNGSDHLSEKNTISVGQSFTRAFHFVHHLTWKTLLIRSPLYICHFKDFIRRNQGLSLCLPELRVQWDVCSRACDNLKAWLVSKSISAGVPPHWARGKRAKANLLVENILAKVAVNSAVASETSFGIWFTSVEGLKGVSQEEVKCVKPECGLVLRSLGSNCFVEIYVDVWFVEGININGHDLLFSQGGGRSLLTLPFFVIVLFCFAPGQSEVFVFVSLILQVLLLYSVLHLVCAASVHVIYSVRSQIQWHF